LYNIILQGFSLLNISVPFSIPFQKRFEHSHIVAGTGHGKTQLLLNLIYVDLLNPQGGKGGFCVIDSQGDSINTILRLSVFDQKPKNPLADKLVYINPEDLEFPVCLNFLDVGLEKLKKQEAIEYE
jgi:hypothetical protein